MTMNEQSPSAPSKGAGAMSRRARVISLSLCVALQMLLVSCFAPSPQRSFTVEDVAGAWQVDYSRYDLPYFGDEQIKALLTRQPPAADIGWVRGIETITLAPDGTFSQRFDSPSGAIEAAGTWFIDNEGVHLQGARFFPYGPDIARKGGYYSGPDCGDRRTITLGPAEVLLCVKSDRDAPGGVVLRHLPVGDPDAPEIVTFDRTETR